MKVLGLSGWNVGDLILRYPNTGDGNGTGDDDHPDDPPVPPASDPPVRTPRPEQKFTQADLDSAASNARGAERERIKGKHERDIESKDAEIARLTQRIEDLEGEIAGYEQSIRDEYVALQDELPDFVKAFAPGEDATGKELKDFLIRARKAVAQANGTYTQTERDELPDPTNPNPPAPPAPPVPPSPPPAPITPQGPVTVTDEIEERRRTGGRRF